MSISPILFIYCLFLAVLGLCCCIGFSLVAASGGYSLVEVSGLRAQAQKWCCTDLVAPLHVGFSWIRDWTGVSHIGRQILYHWATREAPITNFIISCQYRFHYMVSSIKAECVSVCSLLFSITSQSPDTLVLMVWRVRDLPRYFVILGEVRGME